MVITLARTKSRKRAGECGLNFNIQCCLESLLKIRMLWGFSSLRCMVYIRMPCLRSAVYSNWAATDNLWVLYHRQHQQRQKFTYVKLRWRRWEEMEENLSSCRLHYNEAHTGWFCCIESVTAQYPFGAMLTSSQMLTFHLRKKMFPLSVAFIILPPVFPHCGISLSALHSCSLR